jgi:hypothetical protein
MRFFALHSIFVPIRHFFEALAQENIHTTSMQAGFTWDTQDKEFDKIYLLGQYLLCLPTYKAHSGVYVCQYLVRESNSINAYDNTVVKTDDYLSKIIEKMRSRYPDSYIHEP